VKPSEVVQQEEAGMDFQSVPPPCWPPLKLHFQAGLQQQILCTSVSPYRATISSKLAVHRCAPYVIMALVYLFICLLH
jgi:hypothetical protein